MLSAQKNAGLNDVTRLFSGLADLDYEPVDHPSEVYGLPDAHECIDGNLPLRPVLDIDARQKPDPMNPELPFLDKYKITREDLLSRILIACADIIYYDLKHFIILNAFTLASSSNSVANRVGEPYSKFIDMTLYKSHFSLRLLGSAKEDRVKRPAISSVKEGYCKLEKYLVQPKPDYSEIWPWTFSSEKLEKDEFQPIEDETALSKGADLVIAKYEWLEIGNIRRGFINFQARCYRQKQYKPDHKGLVFGEATKFSAKPKRGIVERIGDAISNPRPLIELSEMTINGKRVAFVSTGAVMARALIEKASKLFKPDNSPVRALEAEISFEVTGHFDIVIAITNITTPVHVEALAQMLYRIRDCPRRIISMFYQKNSNELFRPPGRKNIRAELASAQPNNLSTAIKGHREWNNNTISYKVDESLAVITFIEVEHQKRLSARYFIEKLCSLIASTGASLQLIKMDDSRGVIGIAKRFAMRLGLKH
ncbi:hypothetical protein C1646_749566 [Rhizophagus diaphanus]|nr:hypothetical protein C1646_749566 [Rhizophagus diaphanus] [Rhizophagus sp. MUCL 43196]